MPSLDEHSALPLPRSPRYHSLDLWRGLACLMVVISHSTNYAIPDEPWLFSVVSYWVIAITHRLWIGVPVFFVISGYCITATADSSRHKGHSVGRYFQRRLRRIYPPFWTWVGITACTVAATSVWISPDFFQDNNVSVSPPWSLTKPQWIGNLTLTESWRSHLLGGPPEYFLGHTWTLCYEEQFYAVTGILLFFFRRCFFTSSVVLTVACIAIFILKDYMAIDISGIFIDGRWLMFAAGIFVYYRINYAERACAHLIDVVLALSAIWAARDPGRLLLTRPNSFDQSLFIAFSFAMLVCQLHPLDRKLSAVRVFQPLVFCGTICYSLYLVHWPVVKVVSKGIYLCGISSHTATVLITIPACVAAAIALAFCFHCVVERRFLNKPEV